MTAVLCSRLSFAGLNGTPEQETKPGTPVTGRASGAAAGPRPDGHGSVLLTPQAYSLMKNARRRPHG